ncbi:MAG: hypothetical protein WC934_09275 [Acidithiobacillus sp.]|jgi:hypothetical protein|uniref:hypothetical protein n=1 Tax=Acidithiobacillus sp. TaxID=1872118 RepID=UPI00355D6382
MRESSVGILEECADWLESEAQGYRNRALHALKMGQKGSADALLEQAGRQAGRLERYTSGIHQLVGFLTLSIADEKLLTFQHG